MWTWLAAIGVLSLVASSVAVAEPVGAHAGAGSISSSAVSNFNLPAIPDFRSAPVLHDGMIAEEQLAPNAHVGLGLAPMLGRNIRSVRIEQEPVPTRNPGVTFVLRFPQ